MSLARTAVQRPIGTAMVFLAVVLLGIVGLRELAVDLLPEVDMPRITVTTAYEGVAPQDIETVITRPIEQAVSTVDGVERIEATSSEGLSRVQLQFQWGMDLETAVNDVRAQLDRVRGTLPEQADAPLVFKFDLSSASVAQVGVSGTGDSRRLRYLAEEDLTRRLEAIAGIANVDVRGGRRREIRVELSRERLLALGVDVEDVSAALSRENRDVSAGDMMQDGQEVVIRTEGEFRNLGEIGNTVVAVRDGRPIELRDLARVRDGVQEVRDQLWVDGDPAIRMRISKQSDANTVEVVEALRAEIEGINRDYAGSVKLSILRDSGEFIEQSVAGVQMAAVAGGGLALLVLFLFLRNFRATLVIATSIPISVMATVALMYFYGITLNLISFGGLALGIGMLVDNAIVILENVYRKWEEGHPPLEAAIEGANEVSGAVVAGTLTTVSVFVPVVFLGGFAGVFFGQMALVVCFSLLCSLVVALTLVPSVTARALRGSLPRVHPHDDLARGPRGWLERTYDRVLGSVLQRPWTTVGLAVALFATSLLFFDRIGTELMPEADEGQLEVSIELPVGTPLAETAVIMQDAERRIRATVHDSELEHLITTAGPQNWWRPAGSNQGDIDVMLVSSDERERPQEAIIQAVQQTLAELPGARIRVRPQSSNLLLRIMRGGGDDRLSVDVVGHDLAVAERIAKQVQGVAKDVPGVVYARVDRELGQLERVLVVDRARLGELGLGAADVAASVEHYVLGRVATQYREQGDEYDVRVVLREEDRERLDQLADLPIALPAGGTVPLGQVARIEERTAPSSIARENQQRILRVAVGIADRDLGSIVEDLQDIVADIAVPQGFDVRIGGEYREQQETFARLILGAALALFLVYTVMAVQFESLRDPMIVMAAVPFAIVGVILTLLVSNTSLNMNSALGVIVLFGIVINNSIVLIDYINRLRRQEGMDVVRAVRQGSRVRLRPVLMTTLTTILGMLPLAAGVGQGSELQTPLARSVVGGLGFSTLVTLVVVPCLYLLVERRRDAGQR